MQQVISESQRQEFHSGTNDGIIIGDDSFSENVLALAEQKQG